ncbi:MAG: 30S ribosomal protein S6--L-glutamate ligase [Planctomycetes bacterium]|nr:30S ribosomal protein S6--L-glutamate ligase [Planctomycetota bacterium]
MKLGILSLEPKCYSTRRLKEAAQARGHSVRVLDTLAMAIDVDRANPELHYRGKLLAHYDAIIPRIGSSITYFGVAVVCQLEQMGLFCANSSSGIMNSRDKLRSLQILSRHSIGIPRTVFVRDRSDVEAAIERVGGAPVVIKLLEGTQGIGVVLAESSQVAQAMVEALQVTRRNVLVQEFIAESRGRDVRAFVVGDRVVAAMRRVAEGDEFRSNVHRGGRVESVQLDDNYVETAVRATQLLGLQVAGVDLLESNEGPLVMEVNSSPGLEGIEAATGVDVGGEVIDFVTHQLKFPELDIRQRLTVSRGHGVGEIHIPKGSAFKGRTLADTELRSLDIVVLPVERDGEVTPNPPSDFALREGDRLLCFGRLDSMRLHIPDPQRKRRKKTKSTRPAKDATS